MSLERLMGWLRADPARGRALMERNRSYIFFALAPMLDPARGPIGGAGVPLTTGRSLAVDRTLWPYGLPVWIEVSPLTPEGPRRPLDRLMIAQDTGSAILGPARGDFFMGSGAEAGQRAGLVRDSMRFVVFWPRGA
jgi:membrane-bound lytic murein transglycosylase A